MELAPHERALIMRLAAGRKNHEAAVFGPDETEILFKLIEAKVIVENAILFWQTTPGATQNLAEDELLDEEGKKYFAR